MTKDYWVGFYENNVVESTPSSSARHTADEFPQQGRNLVELGCGNGRDSIFFSTIGIKTLGIDQCPRKVLFTEPSDNSFFDYLSTDFTMLNHIMLFDYVYSRWSIHAINEKQENRVLKWAYNSLRDNGKLFIETRGLENELYKTGFSIDKKNAFCFGMHYRRFIDKKNLCQKLRCLGFDILIDGEALYPGESQTLIRVICEKNESV